MDIETESKIASDIINDMLLNYPREDIYTLARERINLVVKDATYKEAYFSAFMRGLHIILAKCYNACVNDATTSRQELQLLNTSCNNIQGFYYNNKPSKCNVKDMQWSPFKTSALKYISLACVDCDEGFENLIGYHYLSGVICGNVIFNSYNSKGDVYSKYWKDTIEELANRINNNNLSFIPLSVNELLKKGE